VDRHRKMTCWRVPSPASNSLKACDAVTV
jgi:hypothetical protein